MAPDGADLGVRLQRGDRSAVPEALNLVDDQRPEPRQQARELLDHLQRNRESLRAQRVGITGAPGVGKSTLLDALVRTLRPERSVGILAIDPSSQQTGGALLGDRYRVRSASRDPGVYIRSMAARNRLGGLADATSTSIEILSAVFDFVFIETVGVGQSESEISRLVDTLVFVAQPGAGDMLQFMKAGILEVPDVFLVNKADLGAPAESTADDRQARETGAVGERRLAGRVHSAADALTARYGSFGLEHIGGREALEIRVREADGESVASLIHALGQEIEDTLIKP